MLQILEAIHCRNPAPETRAGLAGIGPGDPGRPLVVVGDAGQLPLGLGLVLLGLVNEAEEAITTHADYAGELVEVVVSKVVLPYHLENTIRDASQLSFPCADSAYLGPGLGTLRHGSETVAGQGTQKIDSSIYFLELNLSLNVKKK